MLLNAKGVREMKQKGTKNLTYTQRLQIETLFNAKTPKKQIAQQVGCSIRTLYYELKRGAYEHLTKQTNFWYGTRYKKIQRYSAQLAHDKYKQNCTSKGRPIKLGKDFEFVRYVEKRVKEDKLSACAVLGEIKRNHIPFATDISKTTLYRYIEQGFFENIKLTKRKQSYRKQVMKRAPKGTSIEKRPIEIKERKTFGHWEMDCVCGSTKSALLVLSERLTRKEIILKMENQKAESVVQCLNSLERQFGKRFCKVFKSITVDNGSEFADFNGLEKSIYGKGKRTSVYYCHPYCSCERGANERLNREIRRLIPKGSDLSKYSTDDIRRVENWVNAYPRQVLGFATSGEMFDACLQAIA